MYAPACRSRGKGIAREGLRLLMDYAIDALGIAVFVAKILESNAASRSLFASLGYEQVQLTAALAVLLQ